MDEAAGQGVVLKVVARGDEARAYGRRQPDHGFYNACNSSLPELPVRDWGWHVAASEQPADMPFLRDR